jgi:hypothetical protein
MVAVEPPSSGDAPTPDGYCLPWACRAASRHGTQGVSDAKSGLATSAWLGNRQQRNDPVGRKAAVDRGNQIYQFTAAQREECIKVSAAIDDEWAADMDKRGFKGKALLDSAKSLIGKHGRG